jgi:glutamate/tyrosine decarboxylase-like PLP-dependent enzyme
MSANAWRTWLDTGLDHLASWQDRWPQTAPDETLVVSDERALAIMTELATRLEENYPFHHPVYAGQMLKPAHPIANAAYALAQQINPNNHALDGGPATAHMEREAIAQLATMVGFDSATSLGHLTSSGTIANLEALWVSRELHPDKAIAFSAEAHYTHSRMCEVLGVRGVKIASDHHGRLDLDDLRAKLASEPIGTVVATAGTTGIGTVDPIDDLLDLQREFEFRIHVDAAYGGYYTLLADLPPDHPAALDAKVAAAYLAIPQCDSIVIDPHKHGLQPYGCGSVLFRDASVGRFYQHDSPYTYFTSSELHLGEISLECSRAGASAAAVWATLQAFPLEPESGLGPILQKCRIAAKRWAMLIEESEELTLLMQPQLDILVMFPNVSGDQRVSEISALTDRIFNAGMIDGPDAFFLAKFTLFPERMSAFPDLIWDRPSLTALRSVLMKPEHLAAVPHLHERVTNAAGAAHPQ